jgi:uncharacterized protein
MNSEALYTAENHIRKRLIELPATLYYHSRGHIEDVLSASETIAQSEGISAPDRQLLRIAVLYHDAGFVVQADEHEKIGCDMAREELSQFGFSEEEIEKICGMILATKIPQAPGNILEQIICDADLDYLGRNDYAEISDNLRKELSAKMILTEQQWLQIQVNFLEQHTYFTRTAIETREVQKQLQLSKLKARLNR